MKNLSNKIKTHDVHRNEYEADIEKLNISIHVYGIAIKDGKILISPQFNGYDFPGGTAELGETHIETLIREFKEETGCLVEPVELLNVYTSFFHHIKRNKDYQSYMIYYLVNVLDDNISSNGFDDDEKEYAEIARWIDIEELKNMKYSSSINVASELIEKALKCLNNRSERN